MTEIKIRNQFRTCNEVCIKQYGRNLVRYFKDEDGWFKTVLGSDATEEVTLSAVKDAVIFCACTGMVISKVAHTIIIQYHAPME